jgi:ElaB/YqjD/DUF883 family membrane-anchored ribosome-binding protein
MNDKTTRHDKDTDTETHDTEALKRDFAKLRAGLDAVKDRLGGNAHEVLERISDYLDNGTLGARLDDIEDELGRLGGRLKTSSRDAAAKLETEITARPLASITIAFGIGLLAASLLRRR